MKVGYLNSKILKVKAFLLSFAPRKRATDFHCEYCLTEFSNDSIQGVERSGGMGNTFVHCFEDHKCTKCNQKWSYHTIRSSKFKYKFDK